MDSEKRNAVLEVCIKTFVEKGPFDTTVRDLSNALGLQAAGVLYWYHSKDEIVLACAKEIAKRLDDRLFIASLIDVLNSDCSSAVKRMLEKADEMAGYMRFMSSIRSREEYYDALTDVLAGVSERNEAFVEKTARAIGCPYEEIAPHLYQLITVVTDYMLFHGGEHTELMLDKVCKELELIKLKYNFKGLKVRSTGE